MTLCGRPSQFRRLLVAILGVVTVVGLSLVYFNSRSVLVALSRALVDTNYVASAFGAATRSTSSVEGFIDMSIVVFYADDWTLKTLGMFNDKVLTPNLDAMAKRGMTFTHNCVTTSICWQSRATMVTGVYTAIHQQLKIWDWAMFDKKVRWRDTLYPKLFSAGYNVGYVGKWHAPMPAEHRPYTFDYFYPYGGKHWRDRDGEVRHITELNGYDSIQYLRNLQNSSSLDKSKFTLTVAFYATHAQDNTPYPFTYEPDNFTGPLYKNFSGTFPLPQTATQEAWEQMPWFFDDKNEGRRRWRGRYDTEEHRQGNMEHIYRMATEVDKVVGDIMEEVKRMGVYNKTMFIFTTDNGVFHGEHGLSDKWFPQEESIRVPLIIEDPRMPGHLKGTLNEEFTLNLDLAPTILSAAGIQVPGHMQGRDIAQLYTEDYEANRKAWRKDFFYEWSQGRPQDAEGHERNRLRIPAVFALVRKDYKYFYWPQLQYEQLFHIASDPYEERDVMNTTDESVVREVKERYAYLKERSQGGHPV